MNIFTQKTLKKLSLGCIGGMIMASSINANAAVNFTYLTMTVSSDSLQHITGFGAAAIGTLMCPLQDVEPVKLAYGPDSEIGFNIMRIEVSPNPTGNNPGDSQWYDSPYDWHGFVNVVKEGRKRGAIIYACPWSPLPSFKTNNSAQGGNSEDGKAVRATLNENGYKNFFRWLNNFTKYMKSQGAPVNIISLQNEPDWWVNYSGCLYEPSDLVKLVKQSASTFDPITSAPDADHPIKLMSAEPLGYRHDYAQAILEDPESRKYIEYLGGHIYGHPPYKDDNNNDGEMKKSADIAKKYGVKEIWMTEHSYDPKVSKQMPRWDEQLGFAKEVNEVILAGGTAYVYWYLAQYWGFIGDGEEGMTGGVDETTGVKEPGGNNEKNKILPRGYVASHFAKYLAGSDRLVNVVRSSSGVMQEKAGFERNVFTKGDSIYIIGINSSNVQINLKVNLPVAVEEGQIVTSLSNTDLCKKSDLDFDAGVKTLTAVIQPKSVNTIILKRSNPTFVNELKAEPQTAPSLKGIYTLSGMRLDCEESELPKGIYIINGKKVVKN